MSSAHEAWATDQVLLTFNGSVLEIFGFNDTHRLHIAHRPSLQFEEGRRPRLHIADDFGPRHTFDYDPARRVGLDVLAELLRAAYRPR